MAEPSSPSEQADESRLSPRLHWLKPGAEPGLAPVPEFPPRLQQRPFHASGTPSGQPKNSTPNRAARARLHSMRIRAQRRTEPQAALAPTSRIFPASPTPRQALASVHRQPGQAAEARLEMAHPDTVPPDTTRSDTVRSAAARSKTIRPCTVFPADRTRAQELVAVRPPDRPEPATVDRVRPNRVPADRS